MEMIDWSSGKPRALIELVGAGTVLLGLVFVGLELRQNTAAVEAATLQDLTTLSSQYNLLLASDPELSEIWVTGSAELSELDEIEAFRLNRLVFEQWLRFQSAFLQWERGSMSDTDWLVYLRFICRTDPQGVFRGSSLRLATWELHKPNLTDEFVEFVETCQSAEEIRE